MNWRTILLLFLCALYIPEIWAFPKYLEVWFLKPSLSSHFEVKKEHSTLWAQNQVCIPYGDDCFDPQVGIYANPAKSEQAKNAIVVDTQVAMPHLNALESDMINCDKNYYFDLYCGKATMPAVADADLELWIDISSSLRDIDSSSPDGRDCKRHEFVKRVKQKCGQTKVEVVTFDTAFKRVSDTSEVCTTRGLNDQKRMMSWLTNSQAKAMIFVSDVNEETSTFESFLRDHAAVIYESKTLNELVDSAARLSQHCSAK